jgi:uncharacterized membrane protein HdeD (DUF308 family)
MKRETLSEGIRKSWGWILVLGVIYVIIGFIMASAPITATFEIEVLLGLLLIISGIITIVGSYMTGNWKSSLLVLLSGILYLVVGVMLLKKPMADILTLSIVLAVFLLLEGIFGLIYAFEMKPAPNWVWLLVSGITSVILGLMILGEFPDSSALVIGLLVGIYYIINGVSMVMISIALKNR